MSAAACGRGNQDGHAQYSDPLLEQHFLVQLINTVMKSKYWKDTAIIITYDDSDGWYDHVYPPIANPSALNAPAILRFIEDNFNLGRIDQPAPTSVAQGGSFDQIAGSLDSLFDFDRDAISRHDRDQRTLILDPGTGEKARH